MLIVSLWLGVFMGLTYDGLRCIRRILIHNLLFVSIEDFVYWFVWTVLVMDCIFRYNYGELRIYIFVMLLVGFCFYKATIGWVVMRIFNYIWYPVKKCLHNSKKNLKNKKNNSKI